MKRSLKQPARFWPAPLLLIVILAYYLFGATSLAALFLVFLLLVIPYRYYRNSYRPKHLEAKVKDKTKKAPVSPKSIRSDGGAEAQPRTTGLVAKSSLLEAVGLEALDSQDIAIISERALDYLSRYMRADILLFMLKHKDRFEIIAVRGPAAEQLAGSEYGFEGSLAAVLDGEDNATINMPDITVDVELGFEDEFTRRLVKSGTVSLILTAVGKSGVIALAASRPDAFTKFDEAAVEGVAFQLSYILSNIRRSASLKQTVDDFDQLLDSLHQVNRGMDLRETLQSTLESAVELSDAAGGSFFIFDDVTQRLVLEASVGLPEAATAVEIGIGEGITGWVAKHRQPVAINDIDGDAAAQTGLGTEKVATALALPVLLGDRLIGVLNLSSSRAGHEFTAKSLTQIIRLLSQVGAAIVAGQANEEWQELYFDTVKALAQVIESRDPFCRGHAITVSKYAGDLARAMNLSAEEIRTIELAGLLHDIGAAGIRDSVFQQESPLNSVERLMIRSHPRLGSKALSKIAGLRAVLPIILHHHENFDGSGYVDGLKGEEIPLGAGILAVAEAYSAMIADRPYRQAKTCIEAIDELRRRAGTQFDPQIVYSFCKLIEESIIDNKNLD